MANFRLTEENMISFPDGQKIPQIPHSLLTSNVKEIWFEYVWSWDTVQALIGACKVFQQAGKEVHLEIPYMFGSRADRRFKEGQPHYMRDVIAPIINSLGVKAVYTVDPHSDVTEAVIPNLVVISRVGFVESIVESYRPPNWIRGSEQTGKICLIVPDAGAEKKSHEIAHLFDGIMYCSKERDIATGKILGYKINNVVNDCDHYIVVDDICDGGATFLALGNEFYKQVLPVNPNAVLHLAVTHGLFSKGTTELKKVYKDIHCTNSTSFKEMSPNLKVHNIW